VKSCAARRPNKLGLGSKHIILCNGAKKPPSKHQRLVLEYLPRPFTKPNVRIGLPRFVRTVYHLPDRFLDLLEIACYIFAADRSVSRGASDAVEFHSWSRRLQFHIRVRDHAFWSDKRVNELLSESLTFMTGDFDYSFQFEPGQKTDQADLFDRKEFHITVDKPTRVVLFSGGLDSLAGALSILHETTCDVCLVSHHSGQPETGKTQKGLVDALKLKFPGRVRHYSFDSGLKGERATEESQRTRAFLFCSIAFALCHAYDQNEIYMFENGVTSINLPRREDMINARSSRTTHPKTLRLLKELFSLVNERDFEIRSPYLFFTKKDVLTDLQKLNHIDLLASSVSCSKTFQHFENTTHCGMCYQCVDRRFAVYSAAVVDFDNRGLYSRDFITDSVKEPEARIVLVDYVRQAIDFAGLSLDSFADKYARELVDIVDFIDGTDEDAKLESLWNLCRRHGENVLAAIRLMRSRHDDPAKPPLKDSLLKLVDEREYLKSDIQRLIDGLKHMFMRSIPIMFRKNLPLNENDFNDKVDGLLNAEKFQFVREYPSVPFALTKAVPDHSLPGYRLLIESKYLRQKSRLSGITDEMAADLVKYPSSSRVLFLVYDPHRVIGDDERFCADFEMRDTRCAVAVIR
jgi:7-cyano-7-deazaguanine synthase in queuosine biosynthesis